MNTSSAFAREQSRQQPNFLSAFDNLHFIDYRYGKNVGQDDENFLLHQGLTLPDNLTNAIYKRRLEFLAGRYCARQALQQMGICPEETLKISQSKAPKWPAGVVGSITHTKNYAAAVVGKVTNWSGLGIDSEVIVDASKPSLIRHVCNDDEFEHLAKKHDICAEELFTLIFSAKESLFKALNPVVKKFFGFKTAFITALQPNEGRFRIRLHTTLSPKFSEGFECDGFYTISNNRVMTYIFIGND